MKKDIILSGVGGQGILSIATVIGKAALDAGLSIKQAEVHGMSQRGGDVQSNLRIASGEIAIAKSAASPRAANIILLGAAAPFLGIDAEKLEAGIRAIFARKGQEIVEMNLAAFRAGSQYAQKQTE